VLLWLRQIEFFLLVVTRTGRGGRSKFTFLVMLLLLLLRRQRRRKRRRRSRRKDM
jgi:hypothetical protein